METQSGEMEEYQSYMEGSGGATIKNDTQPIKGMIKRNNQ